MRMKRQRRMENRRMKMKGMMPSIKYVTLFWTNSDPLPQSHFVTHLGTPLKSSHISDPPIFSSTCIHTYVFTEGLSWFAGVFVREFCPGFFVWKILSGVIFVRPPSVIIHLLQQKSKHHFQF